MTETSPRILILGAGGALGETVLREAAASRVPVAGLVRRAEVAGRLRALGAVVHIGDAATLEDWTSVLAGIHVIVDLIQPKFPTRISVRALKRIAIARAETTRAVLAAIGALPVLRRPMYVSVGGCDEIVPIDGIFSDEAARRGGLVGGGRIGTASHRLLQDSGIPLVSVYLGMVYGPGKAFASAILPGLAAGSVPIAGDGHNRLPLVHVEDAARALLCLAQLGRTIAGRTFVVADPAGHTAEEFFNAIADRMAVRRPRHLPRWLVALVAGRGAVELMSADGLVEPRALLASGFSFRYPTLETGVRAMVDAWRAGVVSTTTAHA